MIKFDFNKNCCGCTACKNSCPTGAIQMTENSEGFLLPVVDKTKCVDCGKCDTVCPFLNSENGEKVQLLKSKTYLYYLKDEKIRMNSASGGAFYGIAEQFVENGGYVCGCVWDNDLEACHIVSDKIDDVLRMQSSKYTQSNMKNCYSEIKELLKAEKKVFFTGTACQVAGLKGYLGKEYDNLLCAAIICHGVPSPKVWRKYKNALEKRFGGKMTNVNMRDKEKFGYTKSACKYEFDNGKIVQWETYLRDLYCFCFTDDLFIRNSCLDCRYKGNNSSADIILGDYYKNIEGSGNAGVGVVICLNEKGNNTITNVKNAHVVGFDNDEFIKKNNMLWNSTSGNPNREKFFKDFDNAEIIKCIKKYIPFRFKVKVVLNKMGIFRLVRKMIGKG